MQTWWEICAVLAALFVACDAAPVPVVIIRSGWSASSAATLAAVVLLGPVGAAIVGGSSVASIRRLPVADRLFNGVMYALAGFAAGLAYAAVSSQAGMPLTASFPPLAERAAGIPAPGAFAGLILPFTVAAAVHVLVNFGMIALRLRLRLVRRGEQAGYCLAVLPLVASDLGLSALGLVIAALWAVIGAFAVAIVLIPLCMARWAMSQFAKQQGAQADALSALSRAVGTKDLYTRGHGERVSSGSALIARELGFAAARTEAVRIAGLLHDVGKLGVPTRVLQKDGPMTEEEQAAIQFHPAAGLKMVGGIEFLGEALSGIMHHHERMDGCGYPMGLAGEEIPEFARIIAVADAFDSMTSGRSYRSQLSTAEAIDELRKCAGSQFDPVMVDAFTAASRASG